MKLTASPWCLSGTKSDTGQELFYASQNGTYKQLSATDAFPGNKQRWGDKLVLKCYFITWCGRGSGAELFSTNLHTKWAE